MELQSAPLFTLRAKLAEEREEIGRTPRGYRVIVKVREGFFEGPRLRGIVIPGGSDWAVMRPDGVMEVDVRMTLKTDDDALIYMTYTGIVRRGSEAFAARAQGIVPDPATMYFRTLPRFETGHERYAWLNTILAVGVGSLPLDGVDYLVHEIL